MSKPSFVYVTYIGSTPEKVFNALIDPEVTKLYWGHRRNASDWKVGSEWRHQDYADDSLLDLVGRVVEMEPPRRMVWTWASPRDADDPAKHSRVTFEIEPFGETVRLTVTHEDLDAGMYEGISRGWPAVLSSLKTLLETGSPIPWTTKRAWPKNT